MKATSLARAYTEVLLDEAEGWQQLNDEWYPFWVSEIKYDGGAEVTLRGLMIKVDGSRGLLNRQVTVDISVLADRRPQVYLAMRRSYITAIGELYSTVEGAFLRLTGAEG